MSHRLTTAGVIYQGSSGRVAPPLDSLRFTTNSFTWVASMTKLTTAACAMQLVEKGLVGLDDDVRPLVPALGQLPLLRGFVGRDSKQYILFRLLVTPPPNTVSCLGICSRSHPAWVHSGR